MKDIKSIINLKSENEDIEVKYFAKNGGITDCYMDLAEILEYINILEENRDKTIKYLNKLAYMSEYEFNEEYWLEELENIVIGEK